MSESLRRTAWHNMMVAAINEGVSRGIFSLRPGDRWSNAKCKGESYLFKFKGIDAIAYVDDDGWDELHISVALHPIKGNERFIGFFNPGFSVGEAWASGWLERRNGSYLQVSEGKPLFCCRKNLLTKVAGMKVAAKGYKDGPFHL